MTTLQVETFKSPFMTTIVDNKSQTQQQQQQLTGNLPEFRSITLNDEIIMQPPIEIRQGQRHKINTNLHNLAAATYLVRKIKPSRFLEFL